MDGLYFSEEELVEEEDEETAAEEAAMESEGGEVEDSEDDGEGRVADDVSASAAKNRKKEPRDSTWAREMFHLLAKEPDFFSTRDKRSSAVDRVVAALRRKKFNKRAVQVVRAMKSWIWMKCIPWWMTQADRAILEKMRKAAQRKVTESIAWGRQLFEELKNIPDCWENKTSAIKKIVAVLGEKNMNKDAGRVSSQMYQWITKKRTAAWMTEEDKTILKKMRKAAEPFRKTLKRKKPQTSAPVQNRRSSSKRRRIQKSPEDSKKEAEEKEEAPNEPKNEDQISEENGSIKKRSIKSKKSKRSKKEIDQVEDQEITDEGGEPKREPADDVGPIHFNDKAVPMELMDEVPPPQMDVNWNIFDKEEKTPTREQLSVRNRQLHDENEALKKLQTEKEKEILKLKKKIRNDGTSKEEENEELKRKLIGVQKRLDEISEESVEGGIDEKGVPEELKTLLELKGSLLGHSTQYKISQAIGYGTFGLVFSATRKETKEVSALKIVVDENAIEEERLNMDRMNGFQEKNKYVCAPTDSFRGIHRGVGFTAFSMELLSIDLFSLFWEKEHKKKQFLSETVLQILAQLFSALDFLNRHGIIYSDLKQENVMMKEFEVETRGDEDLILNPVIRLIDFNSTMEIGKDECSLCQTARLRAPEVILGLKFDARIDSWSAGILALELLEKQYFINVEYPEEDKETQYEHLALIEFALNKAIPNSMWATSLLDESRVPEEIEDQRTVAEVIREVKPSSATLALRLLLPELLTINPEYRLSPNKALSFLEYLLPK